VEEAALFYCFVPVFDVSYIRGYHSRKLVGHLLSGGTEMKKFLLAILILLIAGLAYLYLNKDKIARVAIEKSIPLIETSLLENLPADVNKEDVKEVFNRIDARVKEGKIDIMQMQTLLEKFREALKDQKVDEAEFHQVFAEIKKLAGD